MECHPDISRNQNVILDTQYTKINSRGLDSVHAGNKVLRRWNKMLVFVEAFWRAHRHSKVEGIKPLYPKIVLLEGHQVVLDALLEGNYSWSVVESPTYIPTYIERFDVEGIGSLTVKKSFQVSDCVSRQKLQLTLTANGESLVLDLRS